MVNYLNSELCNTLGNLLNRCTSKSINSSQTFPSWNADVYDGIATEEWRELNDSLQHLPGMRGVSDCDQPIDREVSASD